MKEFADNNFKYDENGTKFPKREENTGEKEKLLITSNFSFFHIVFESLVLQTHKNKGLKIEIWPTWKQLQMIIQI